MTTDDEAERAAHAKKGGPFLSTAQAAFYVDLLRRTLDKMRRRRWTTLPQARPLCPLPHQQPRCLVYGPGQEIDV